MIDMSPRLLIPTLFPSEVLYYYDGPVIFFSNEFNIPLLCSKIDEIDNQEKYLVVVSSPSAISGVKDGKISLRAAFSQPWFWIMTVDEDYHVQSSVGHEGKDLSDSILPMPGVGLYAHHGFINDSHSCHLDGGFLSFYFRGGSLSGATIPFRTFKTMTDDVYSSVRKIFAPAVEDLSVQALSETALNNLYDVPVREPQFASLNLRIERPVMRQSVLGKRKIHYNKQEIAAKFEHAALNFVTQAHQLEGMSNQSVSINRIDLQFTTIDILRNIAPSETTVYDTVEIRRGIGSSSENIAKIDAKVGDFVREYYSSFFEKSELITGSIEEINLRSSTFIIKSRNGRQITCDVSGRELRAAFSAFSSGVDITVAGKLSERTRRDYLFVTEIHIPDGTILRRNS